MHIDKPGFYKLDTTAGETVTIADGVSVCLYDTCPEISTFEIGNDAKLHYFSYFTDGEVVKKLFKIAGQKSDVIIRSFHYSFANNLKVTMTGELQNSFSKLDMNLVSIVGENGSIDIDGIVQINENIAQVEGYLREQNIFLGNTGKIRGIPTLLVRSNDVKASHGCNIEKISDEKLFYLRSRGLDKPTATRVMLESYVRNTFGYLEKIEPEFYHSLVEKIVLSIQ